MNSIEILKAARKTLVEKGWAKEFYAFTSNGVRCAGWNPDACRFCALGAVQSVRGAAAGLQDGAYNALEAALPAGWTSIAMFNDAAESVDDVLALFDRAIEIAESK